MNSSVADQVQRDAFCKELGSNFSVIAPAGSGKTRAIVDRIMGLALQPPEVAMEQLPRLVVVTYTNKAAGEMLLRVRREMTSAQIRPEVVSCLNQAFFGTIHSFCLRLARQYGHYLGIPGKMELVGEEEKLWNNFINQFFEMPGISDDRLRKLSRYVELGDLLKVGRSMAPGLEVGHEISLPILDGRGLMSATSRKGRGEDKVAKGKRLFQGWQENEKHGDLFNPPPELESEAKDFKQAWMETFAPFKAWLGNETRNLSIQIAEQYRQYRLNRRCMTFYDQVSLALDLFGIPEAANAIRMQEYSIILDEAQDTDPTQFEVLLESVRPVGAAGYWMRGGGAPPRAGAFCMVGDPQQSIYGDRADLIFYQKARDLLVNSGAREIEFKVTFRCDRRVISFVNERGESLLDGVDGQAKYVSLNASVNAREGQAVALKVPVPFGDLGSRKKNLHESAFLARWLKETGLDALRARQWSEVAILCPRKSWLFEIAQALHKVHLKTQIQSHDSKMRNSAWLLWGVALCKVMHEPRNSYEIVGVLREIFGISDQELYDFCKGSGALFQIAESVRGKCAVSQTLNFLKEIRSHVRTLPLRDGVDYLVSETRLRERLGLIGDDLDEGGEEDLDYLILLASEAEARNSSWGDLLEQLETLLDTKRSSDFAAPDAIQLITSQKSKGLEWDAIIIPFMNREMRHPSPSYPRAHRVEGSHDMQVIWDKEDGEFLRHRKFQEHQRLLYVSMTRARHTLVLVDDSELLAKRGNNSWAHALYGKEGEEAPLPLDLSPLPAPTSVDGEKKDKDEWPFLKDGDFKKAFQNASSFIQRILPHSLAHQASIEEPEVRSEAVPSSGEVARNLAIDYGTWWHGLCQRMPWDEGGGAWALQFERERLAAPDLERAKNEWAGFLNSELAQLFQEGHFTYHTEMPILAPMDQGRWIEGIVDLALYDQGRKEWLIIDWKTDAGEDKDLVQTYSPQLSAYVDAVRRLSGQNAKAAIFSTRRSKLYWIPGEKL